MRTFRIFLCLLVLFPTSSFAVSGMLDPTTTVDQLSLLIKQYTVLISQLQAENTILKNEMMKANIKIPLSDFSGAIAQTLPTQLTTATSTSAVLPLTTTSSVSSITNPEYRSFVTQIHKDWTAIQKAYALPEGSYLAGYEFVQTGGLDHVFADISYRNTASGGVYDAKILYQYEKKEYKRKLIGYFVYDGTTQKYITKSGSNPFGGVSRNFLKDPDFGGINAVPGISVSSSGTSVVAPTNPTPVAVTGSVNTSSSTTIASITQAYTDRRYLTTISLAKNYLASNPAQKDVLSILYRTYFIIGRYPESLSALAQLETLGTLSRETACDAEVVATYSKNTALTTKYHDICNQK